LGDLPRRRPGVSEADAGRHAFAGPGEEGARRRSEVFGLHAEERRAELPRPAVGRQRPDPPVDQIGAGARTARARAPSRAGGVPEPDAGRQGRVRHGQRPREAVSEVAIATRRRRVPRGRLLGLGLVLLAVAAAVVATTVPFGGRGNSTGDNGTATGLATVE